MRIMPRTRNTLTPMIGLSLAALVAGSLITLAVLAQRVTLDVPMGVEIQPRRSSSTSQPPPLVVAGGEAPEPRERPEPRTRAGEIEDQVLPLRISRAAAPAPDRKSKGNGGRKPGKPQ